MEKEIKHYFRTGFSQAGTVTAFILSWSVNHSILWGIIHCILGWIYNVYWLLKYSKIEEMVQTWLMR